MPVQYRGLLEEHAAVRTAAGLFDVSHMGEIELSGPRALDASQWLLTNDVGKAREGQAVYAGLLNERGGFVDDVVAYRFASDRILLCVNASNREKDFAWIHERSRGATAIDRGDEYAQLAIQGPKSAAILQKLTLLPLAPIGTYRFVEGEVAGIACTVARTGYTGEDGFELFCAPERAPALWNAIVHEGDRDGLLPCGLGARDTLRTEMKYALYGNDIDDDHTPLEAGLSWIVKLDKGDFVGKPALEKQKALGLARKLVGFTLTDKGIPRHGYAILKGGVRVGEVTSGTLSPSLKIPIGIGYVPAELSVEGATFEVDIRGRPVPVRVVKTPFYKPSKT
jgi:aminomethyltransferase